MGKTKKRRSLAGLKREADRVFSLFIRQRDAAGSEMSSCVTCGTPKRWFDLDCGHFWKRTHLATRYDERNCNSQCTYCNHFRSGAEAEHAAYILKTYGREVFEELETLHRRVVKLSRQDYEYIIDKYK